MRKGKWLLTFINQAMVQKNDWKLQYTTIMGTMNTFKTTGTVVNLPGKTQVYFVLRTLRKTVWEAKKSPRATVGEWPNLVASWGHQVSKYTIKRHFLYWEQPTNVNAWSLLNGIGPWIGTGCYGRMRLKLSSLATHTSGGFGLEWRMHMQKRTLYLL